MSMVGFDKGIDSNEEKLLRRVYDSKQNTGMEMLLYYEAWLGTKPDNVHNRGC